MLAYAANRPIVAQRRSSPNAMLAIIAAHVAVVAVVMSARMDLPGRILDPPIKVTLIPGPKPPPEDLIKPPPSPVPIQPTITDPIIPVPTPIAQNPIVTDPPIVIDPAIIGGAGAAVTPALPTIHNPIKLGPVLATPPSQIKPPYPESKLASGEGALLKLRLTIDERGRVVAVEPVGQADRVFLAAARRHLMAHWRYRPASEGGRAVMSSEVISLRFQLDG